MAVTVSSHVAVKAGIVELVQADGDLMGLIQGRIFPTSLAELTVDSQGEPKGVAGLAFPRIHYRIVGGGAQAYGKLLPTNLLVNHWSKEGYAEAWTIARNFRRVIDHKVIEKAEIQACLQVLNPGQEVFDPTQQLYYIVQQYRITIIELT